MIEFSTASLLSFSVNVAYGWTSPTLPLLKDPNTSPIPISNDESSWIVAIYVIGTIVGIIIGYCKKITSEKTFCNETFKLNSVTIPVAYSMEK